jgi:hypothetical protein
MRYRQAFTSWVACGASAISETGTLICAQTLSKSSGPGSRLAVLKKRVAESGQRLLLICRPGIAVLALMIGQLAVAQAGSPSSAGELSPDRLTIVNPRHYDVPEDRVRVLFLTTCRVVAEEFHRHPSEIDLTLTLVIGDKSERSMIDPAGHLALYMDHWSEGKFVDGVITGAVQQLTTVQARTKMFKDILRRSDQIAPVSVSQLRGGSSNRSVPVVNVGPDCFRAVTDSPCPWLSRTVPHH